ncbi:MULTISPECIES: dihydroxyacetone kinase subunit DhaL [Pseudofrankia]|uniref:dihydroxyacetone kinase subunit DhaL n=1 Tax=Pseudofrankia TaxID=2994363 RepID=UPI000234C576|nr:MULTISPECIES: dihydroxyacetone kinase subunit DhaL [Pseudofrankia]
MVGTAIGADAGDEAPGQEGSRPAPETSEATEAPEAPERASAASAGHGDQASREESGRGLGLDLDAAYAWIASFQRRSEAEATELGELDRRAGDGDFGANIRRALRRVERRLDEAPPATPGELFLGVAHGFLNTGGTSGPLFGLWFRGIGQASDAPVMTLAALAKGVDVGTATVQRLGKARPGDKTMVDAMAPAADALAAAVADGLDVAGGVALAAEAARAGALATESMRARRGRAAYVGDLARGVLDPGALTVALFFDSALA